MNMPLIIASAPAIRQIGAIRRISAVTSKTISITRISNDLRNYLFLPNKSYIGA